MRVFFIGGLSSTNCVYICHMTTLFNRFTTMLFAFFFFLKVRSSLFEVARKTKYNFWQHLIVTIVLLSMIDLLVIFIPSMKDIFGAIGKIIFKVLGL